jgi:simple sugar transport system permease protein
LLKATPLILCGIGLALCYQSDVWNIGAEGQLILGGIGAATAVLALGHWPAGLLMPTALVCGVLAGMAWAGITAFLRDRFFANEILVSLMLVYIAQLLLIYLVTGPLRDPGGYNFPQSKVFPRELALPKLIEGTRLHWGFLLAILTAAVAWVLMKKSFLAYQMQVGGLAARAARYAGFSARRSLWLSLLLCGALAGLAGALEVLGPIAQLLPQISPGYGFAAIIVAWIGRLHPLGVVLGALLMSLFFIGGEYAQSRLGLPSSITSIFQGALLLCLLACDTLIDYRLSWQGGQNG